MVTVPRPSVVRASSLGAQLFIGHQRPMRTALGPWVNATDRSNWLKPLGGLWTSTLRHRGEHYCSDWAQTALGLGLLHGDEEWWVLDPFDYARVVVIDTREDLAGLIARYPLDAPPPSPRVLDWPAVRDDGFAGVHVTPRAAAELRQLWPDADLWSWDCESTAWGHWCFDEPWPLTADRRPSWARIG